MLTLEFRENRYKHCYGVGLKMYAYARFILGWDERRSAEMFVLGNMHDIGYWLDPDTSDHGWVLAEILLQSSNIFLIDMKNFFDKIQNKEDV